VNSIPPPNHHEGVSLRRTALIAGLGYLLMPVSYGEFSIFPRWVIPHNIEQTGVNSNSLETFFVVEIFCNLITLINDVVSSWALYILLVPVNRSLALLTAWFRLVNTTIALCGLLNLVNADRLLKTPEYLAAVGFAPTYYLAGRFKAPPLPNLIVHIHGAVFTLWIVLFIGQISLISMRRVDVHRRLGLLGFGLACLVVILGAMVATESLVRNYPSPGESVVGRHAFYAISLSDIFCFALLIYFAYRSRFDPAAHKRFVLIVTLSLMDAAYDRWPVPVPWWDDRVTPLLCTYPLLFLLMAYDGWSTGKIQRSTLWATLFLVVVQQGRDAFGHSTAWQTFAAWVYLHARALH
jgi:hypothetical protein